MTQPNPTASIANGSSIQDVLKSLNSETAPSTASKSTDLFGLGDWGAQNINPGDLPTLSGLIATGGQTTGNAVVQAFASGDPGAVAQIQRALYLGGFYGQTSKYVPTYGVVSAQDLTAFGDAVTLAGKTKSSVSNVLLTHAQVGTASGLAAAAQGTTAETKSITLPNTQDLEAEAVKAFQAALGKKATPEQAAAFAASYRAMSAGMQRTANQQQYDAQQGVGLSPQQETQLQGETANVGTPPSLAPTTGVPGLPPPNDQMIANDTAETPDFSQQLSSLGEVAAQAQQDALPTKTATGLTQVTQESPEDPSVAAENFAQNSDPQRAGAHDIASQFNTFLSLLSGNFGGGVPGGQ